ncbi:dTDP-4-dehydrorhamnose 3,5-epimerase [Microvirga mediterraneensis]|uniref:dTDP-4-dehydrorhamnose 3,5-epimerase n=1 Tax=Microvirga mediterraneensis TaxID=2754695 RepID=A0A838BQY6_9HYPH|nr:dTDP-4-dehydrorhamnose 3,5-epimerase [Microvirga mediterraneensis]MBA1158184.1 dTDP-4-dehydrorhamnose 3,5-epimerase [Microvirga mediterraneensis]
MQVFDTPLSGCRLIKPTPLSDERGYFVRLFDADVFVAHDLNPALAQASLSYNLQKGTLRGLHFQAHPRMEDKLVRCASGAVFDVAVDIRPGSPTFGQWYGVELSADNNYQLYIPAGFAHGFQALTSNAVVAYHISVPYDPALTAGLRFDDPDVAVDWPLPPAHLSERDRCLPRLSELGSSCLMPYPGFGGAHQ